MSKISAVWEMKQLKAGTYLDIIAPDLLNLLGFFSAWCSDCRRFVHSVDWMGPSRRLCCYNCYFVYFWETADVNSPRRKKNAQSSRFDFSQLITALEMDVSDANGFSCTKCFKACTRETSNSANNKGRPYFRCATHGFVAWCGAQSSALTYVSSGVRPVGAPSTLQTAGQAEINAALQGRVAALEQSVAQLRADVAGLLNRQPSSAPMQPE